MSDGITVEIEKYKEPDLSVVVDADILKSVEGCTMFYSDIINMQLIRTMKKLTESLNKSNTDI